MIHRHAVGFVSTWVQRSLIETVREYLKENLNSANVMLRASIAYERGDVRCATKLLDDAASQLILGDWLSDVDKASASSDLTNVRRRIESRSLRSGDAKSFASLAFAKTRSREKK